MSSVVEDIRSAVSECPQWHPTPQERAVCESLEGGCQHDAEFMASLPWWRAAGLSDAGGRVEP